MKYFLTLIIISIGLRSYSQATLSAFFAPGVDSIKHFSQVNTKRSDISPFIVNDDLFYSSQNKKYYSLARVQKNIAFYSIYSCKVKNDGTAVAAACKIVPGFGNGYHEGPASYCKATGELFVTKSNVSSPDTIRKTFSKLKIRLRLVIMKKINGKWQETEDFPYNNSRYHFAHPAISKSGDTLIFSSDMPGGFGKSDLYMSVRQNGQWAKPVNLGGKINTKGDEMFPTFLPEGILAFSSDAHKGGNGKFDIWYVRFPVSGEVENAGQGINSVADDFGMVVYPERNICYFCSNRAGGSGNDDIYYFRTNKFRLDIITKSGFSEEILPYTSIVLAAQNGPFITKKNTDDKGTVSLFLEKGKKYSVWARKKGYDNLIVDIDLTEVSGQEQTKEIFLNTKFRYKGTVINKIDKKPVSNATIQVGNKILTTGTNGEFVFNVKPGKNYVLTVAAPHYLEKEKNITTEGMSPGEIITGTIELIPFKEGTRFELENLYYDYNKWNLRPEASRELDKLVKELNRHPDFKIKLESHTDSRGRDKYNLWLSLKRSKTCFDYLVSKGIRPERVKYMGYGESRLINQCWNGMRCSEDEHQENRRTVITILHKK